MESRDQPECILGALDRFRQRHRHVRPIDQDRHRMQTGPASWSALFQGRHAIYTILLILAVGVHATGMHLLATILPSVVADIGGVAFYAWVTMLYTIASIVGTACGGLLTARLGLCRCYVVGGGIVLAGVVGCALAPHMGMLLVSRVIQGLGSGLLVALAYSMVSELYAVNLRARVLSAISGIWGAAALLGPTIGGTFAGIGWWRGAFWGAAPLLLLLMCLAFYALPARGVTPAASSPPLLRLAMLGGGVLGVASSGHLDAWGMRLAIIMGSGLLLGLTFHLDTRSSHRLFPSQPLSVATSVGTASWMFLLFGMTTSQVTVFMPLTVQTLYGLSPLGAGYFTSLLSFTWTVMALSSASLPSHRVRTVILLGPVAVTCGVVGLVMMVGADHLILFGAFLALTGAGIGICFAHIGSWTIAAARPQEETLTASAIPALQSLGIAFGAATAGLAANAAGLGSGVSREAVASASTWSYGLSGVAAGCLTGLTLRFLWLYRKDYATASDTTGH